MHRTGRGVLGNKPASGTEIIQELGEEHQQTGKWIVYTSADSVFQIAAHEDTIPLEELYEACEVAREILTGKHAVGRVIARPFTGEPGNYERTPNRHDFSLEPRRPNYLSLIREAGAHGARRREDRRHLRRLRHRRVASDEVERRGDPADRASCCRSSTRASSSRTSSRRTCSGATGTTRSTSIAASRTSTAACPTCSTRCRPGDLLVLTSDHGCDPTTPSTDHSREHALLLAVRRGQERRGPDPRGRVRRRRRDGERLARRARRRRVASPGSRSSSHEARQSAARSLGVRERVEASGGAIVRRDDATGPDAREVAFEAVAECAPIRVLEVGAGPGELAERIQRELNAEVAALDISERMVELARARGVDARVGDVQELPVRRRRVRLRGRGLDALPRARRRPWARRARTSPPAGRSARRRHEQPRAPARAVGAVRRRERGCIRFQRRGRPRRFCVTISSGSSGGTPTAGSTSQATTRPRPTSPRRHARSLLAELPQ